jgi:transcriptional regulator with XRE-family HTH domain
MKVEIRAVGLKAMREKHGLTYRKLAHDRGISQNSVAAIEAGARRAGPKLQDQLAEFVGCRFEELLDIVLVDPDRQREQLRKPRGGP